MQVPPTPATNTERYQSIDDTLPAMLPPITREEATRANHLLCRHFGRKSLGPVTMLNPVTAYRTRVCWLSPKPTRGCNHDKGWGRLIHDVSHYIFGRRHPNFRPHDGGHVTLEREIAQYVIDKGWLDGKLKPKVKKDQRLAPEVRARANLHRIELSLARWESKYRRAERAILKLKRRRAGLTRRLAAQAVPGGLMLEDIKAR